MSLADFMKEIQTEDIDIQEKIKQAIKSEFKNRALQGKTNYSIEEVLYIINEVIDNIE